MVDGMKPEKGLGPVSLLKEKFETRRLPLMPIRDVVIFPFMMTQFVVGRE